MFCDHSNCKWQRNAAGNCFQDRYCLEYERVTKSRAKCRMAWFTVKRRFIDEPYTSNYSEYHYYHPYRKTDFFGHAQIYKSPIQAMAYGVGNEVWHGLKCNRDHRDRIDNRQKNEVNCCMLLERVSVSTMRLIVTHLIMRAISDAAEVDSATIPLGIHLADALIENEVSCQRSFAEDFALDHAAKHSIGSLQWRLAMAYYFYAETLTMGSDTQGRRFVSPIMEVSRRLLRIDPTLDDKLDFCARKLCRHIVTKQDGLFFLARKFKREMLRAMKQSQDAGLSPAPTAYGDPGLDESSTAVLAEGVPHEG